MADFKPRPGTFLPLMEASQRDEAPAQCLARLTTERRDESLDAADYEFPRHASPGMIAWP